MKPLWKRILISAVLLTAAYYGGRLAGIWGAPKPEVIRSVILVGFMGTTDVPVSGVILESKAGYIKIRLQNGNVIEHSGNYTVFR